MQLCRLNAERVTAVPISYVKIRIADFPSTFEFSSYILAVGRDIFMRCIVGRSARVNSKRTRDLLSEVSY